MDVVEEQWWLSLRITMVCVCVCVYFTTNAMNKTDDSYSGSNEQKIAPKNGIGIW